jgi:hypothetical protein
MSCATLGADADFPDPVQTSGVGPFRLLDAVETGLEGEPVGRVMDATGATGGGLFVEGFVFHVHADPLAAPPERDPTLAPYEVDWARFEPRSIRRSAANANTFGTTSGEVVLQASEAWEGDAVFDPWAVVLADGTHRLYYAAEGGLGIAEGPAGGALTKVPGPIAGPVAGARAPSVVVADDGSFRLFYEAAGVLRSMTSSDGLAFGADAAVPLMDPELPFEAGELSHHRPGAVYATMPSGRRVLRLYFEVRLDDDTQLVTIATAAAEDLSGFERLSDAVWPGDEFGGAPMPFLDDEGRTRLYFTLSTLDPDVEPTRTFVVGLAPAFERLVPLP